MAETSRDSNDKKKNTRKLDEKHKENMDEIFATQLLDLLGTIISAGKDGQDLLSEDSGDLLIKKRYKEMVIRSIPYEPDMRKNPDKIIKDHGFRNEKSFRFFGRRVTKKDSSKNNPAQLDQDTSKKYSSDISKEYLLETLEEKTLVDRSITDGHWEQYRSFTDLQSGPYKGRLRKFNYEPKMKGEAVDSSLVKYRLWEIMLYQTDISDGESEKVPKVHSLSIYECFPGTKHEVSSPRIPPSPLRTEQSERYHPRVSPDDTPRPKKVKALSRSRFSSSSPSSSGESGERDRERSFSIQSRTTSLKVGSTPFIILPSPDFGKLSLSSPRTSWVKDARRQPGEALAKEENEDDDPDIVTVWSLPFSES